MIKVQAEVMCDWCGARESVNLKHPDWDVQDWEAAVGADEDRPCRLGDAIEMLGHLVMSFDVLCPKCCQHVGWTEDLKLYATDPEGESLRKAWESRN